ncbi:Hypothetical predicted protein [Paramuricea clavata]|uniref:Uncharacterized protein n=1 Tax=Paramuricea clavata TaxID=317549 RepID=A0A6S7IK77_PARCT|nr:Hypothetical predicted protein [Paramuricea clavata]
MSLIERFKLVRRKGLCDNCLTRGHLASNCPKDSFCKVQDCKEKHSTFLHESVKPNNVKEGQHSKRENTESKEIENKAQTGYVKLTNGSRSKSASDGTAVGLAIVPVKVKAMGSDRTVETYAFLDGGSNTSFCSQDLMKRLNIKGKRTTLSLTTMEKANSKTESSILRKTIAWAIRYVKQLRETVRKRKSGEIINMSKEKKAKPVLLKLDEMENAESLESMRILYLDSNLAYSS